MKEQVKGQRIKIMGNWEGKPIWRFMTSGEILAEEIEKQKKTYPIKIKING